MSLVLLRALDLQHYKLNPEGKWPTGRFRDIYISGDGTRVILFTRNGGGNRECWAYEGCDIGREFGEEIEVDGEKYVYGKDDHEAFHDKDCLVFVNWRLTKHPLYIRDYDDDFDYTYAYFEFKMPEKLDPVLDKLLQEQGGEPKSLFEKTQEVLEEMKSMSKEELEHDERFKPLVDIIKKIKDTLE